MSFALWEHIPPETPLRDLYTTSLLAHTDATGHGVLLRCSAGLEEGSTLLVHASTTRPNSLRMLGVDDDTHIGRQVAELIPNQSVKVVAIPHIAWRHPRRSERRWRMPILGVGALATGIPLALWNPPLSALAAIPVAALVGLLLWMLMRPHVSTQIAPVGILHVGVDDIVSHVSSAGGTRSVNDRPLLAQAEARFGLGMTVRDLR